MKNLLRETLANRTAFDDAWRDELTGAIDFYADKSETFVESYRRACTLQGWRSSILASRLTPDAMRFFVEAQNDVLCSHVFARMGAARAALKSLRSSIENVLASLYYTDHPVEFSLWSRDRHRLNFKDYLLYFRQHPTVLDLGADFVGLTVLKEEYSTLSRAVHSSAEPFRMTTCDSETLLWTKDKARLSKWATREKHTLCALNKLLLSFFAADLQGTAASSLRKTASLAIPKKDHSAIRAKLNVTLFARKGS